MAQVETRALAQACDYCQSDRHELYKLHLVHRLGDRSSLAVCVFCYLRLAGTKPKRSALLERSCP